MTSLQAGEILHGKIERVLQAKRRWRAIARALGFNKDMIRLLARSRREGLVEYCYLLDGRVDGYMIRHQLEEL